MSARAEMTTNAQSPQAEKSASNGMSVALIGPNDAHRKIVARALAASNGRKVHEFIDYPGNLNDLAGMVEQNFDFVLVDVDTDESYALQIIEKLAEIGQPVMAYSARTDQELLMSCMRAGARDFLPLPTENAPEESHPELSRPAPPPAVPVAKPAVAVAPPPVAARPVEPKPAPTQTAPVARTNVKPITPEKRLDPGAEAWMARAQEERKDPPIAHKDPAIEQVIQEITIGSRAQASGPEMAATESAPSEFAAWDAANLRRAPLAPMPEKRTESRPRPALVPERRKTEAQPRTVSSPETATSSSIERPPVAVELFRSSVHTESEPDEAAEKQGANWIKWILIAAGPLVLALVLLVVFTHPSASKPVVTTPVVKETQPAPEQNQASLIANQPVNATPKPAAATALAKPAATPAEKADSTDAAPVSPDAMAQQLVAPTRIAGSIKKAAPADEPPPSAPAAVTMDDNTGVSGSVFGSASKAKVAPHVVAISAGVADGMILRKTPPVYPKFAQDAHITGKVVLKATITRQGTIEGVQVLSGPKILAPAAVDAVKTWKYKPYTLDNQPVAVETDITIVFGTAGK